MSGGPASPWNRVRAAGRPRPCGGRACRSRRSGAARDAGPCRDADARPACSRPATSPPARSSAGRSTGIARRSSSPSPTLSPRGSHPETRCTSSSTPSRRTGPHVAEGPARPDVPLHPDPGVPDGRRRGVLPEAVRTEAEGCGLRPARRMHHGDRGMHRAPRCPPPPSVPMEPEAGGPRRGVQGRTPETSGNGTGCMNQSTGLPNLRMG